MKILGSLHIPEPPAGVCPHCYSRSLLAAVERNTRLILSLYFDAHPPKMGDYCGQTSEAAAASAERLLKGSR